MELIDIKKKILKTHVKVEWLFGGDMEKAIYAAMEEYKNTDVEKVFRKEAELAYYEATKNKSCQLCGFFCNNTHHFNNWYDIDNSEIVKENDNSQVVK